MPIRPRRGPHGPSGTGRAGTIRDAAGIRSHAEFIDRTEEVHALVVNRDGTILARGSGDPLYHEWDGILAALRGA